ncbi:MAG: dihydroorotate dehydrogenase [Candidatus Omnitrophica bacterium]|nr:dihydroorotate dehydrogenase [Candidatus Omnitrophota bacterium]
MADMRVTIAEKVFKNPVWVASGTFGSGKEFEDLLDLSEIGAIVTKTVTLESRQGNRPPRLVETASGMLNAIGLENKGARVFAEEDIPFLRGRGLTFIVSISGPAPDQFAECAGVFTGDREPSAIEVNLSCPNVAHEGTRRGLLAQDPGVTERIVREVKAVTRVPVIAKLTPNVTDISETAKAAEQGGADAVAIVNTFPGMAVDAAEMKPVLGNIIGGLSGPAIKPLALKAVWDARNSIDIPIIGIGGIMSGTDVAEFLLTGASAVQVGTANLADPSSHNRILREFKGYLEDKRIARAADLTGTLRI